MDLVPKITQSEVWRDLEILSWKHPFELKGRVLDSLDELKELIPQREFYGSIGQGQIETENFIRYYRKDEKLNITEYLAYGCNECGKIIIGPPRIEVRDTIAKTELLGSLEDIKSAPDLLSGIQDLAYHCTNCDSLIKEKVYKRS